MGFFQSIYPEEKSMNLVQVAEKEVDFFLL